MAHKCPCCGSPLSEPTPLDGLRHAPVGPIAKRAIEVLLDVYPHTMSIRDLAGMVYMNAPDGGADWAEESLTVLLSRANRQIACLGWRIGALAPGRRHDMTLRPLT